MYFRHFLSIYLLFFIIHNSCLAAPLIQSRIDEGAWKKQSAIYPIKGQTVTLRVTKVVGATVRWYQIVPDISKIYKNANHPWEKNAYQWVGLGKIDYERKALTHFHNQWEIQPFKEQSSNIINNSLTWLNDFMKDTENPRFYQEKMGSFWFQVEIEKRGKIKKSSGINDLDERGLSPKVFRVSIRGEEGYLGYLTSFFNVPAIFGSTTYQSNHYIGVDCADVLVAAYGQWKGKHVKKNYNVAMLVNKLSKKHEFDLNNGMPDKKINWGKAFHSGDFIAVRYPGARQYQHIGALFQDTNNNGQLDGDDLVIHAGPLPLHYSYLKEGYFDGHVVILRPSNRLLWGGNRK
ncbi:hypothetical protein [Candidatus Parabeggiatoa sp. HSG14]|uniref:hypothetical protein n=1 Tax=Candidatus Parabeggiatoa sp. HSG14 TaxID=3055593 RepID=UPI0025A6AB9F|nr:hypothetical protein [Thiotrichales bacterium HSG14]